MDSDRTDTDTGTQGSRPQHPPEVDPSPTIATERYQGPRIFDVVTTPEKVTLTDPVTKRSLAAWFEPEDRSKRASTSTVWAQEGNGEAQSFKLSQLESHRDDLHREAAGALNKQQSQALDKGELLMSIRRKLSDGRVKASGLYELPRSDLL